MSHDRIAERDRRDRRTRRRQKDREGGTEKNRSGHENKHVKWRRPSSLLLPIRYTAFFIEIKKRDESVSMKGETDLVGLGDYSPLHLCC